MKIYTRAGDTGETGLYGGGRVRKNVPRIDAYGDVDELNSVLGLARASGLPAEVDRHVAHLQNELFDVGAELATPDSNRRVPVATPEKVAHWEAVIDEYEEHLPELKNFILPGGTQAAAALHLARTVCRRAERRVLTLAEQPDTEVSPLLLAYLNRLSDLLFVLARAANRIAGVHDVAWEKS